MMVYFSPIVQFSENFDPIIYAFEQGVVKVTYKDKEETFDFRGLPDGKLKDIEVEFLDINPVSAAEIIDGTLYVTLKNFIRPQDSEFHKFPEWIEVE